MNTIRSEYQPKLSGKRGEAGRKAKRFYGTASALLVFLLLAPGAVAQDGNLRLSVFGGGSFLKGERSFIIDGSPKRSDFAKGGKFGFRGTADLNSHWAVEGAYSYGTNNLRIFDIGTTTRERAFGTRIHQITGNALYYLGDPESKFRPFLTAGGGLMRFGPTSEAKSAATIRFIDEPATISATNGFDFNYGGGVEAKVSDFWGLRFDVRDHLAKIPRFGIPEAPTAGIADFFPVSGATHDVETSIGIVIYLRR